MDTKNIHLTDMTRELANDHTGSYRKKLMDQLLKYRQDIKTMGNFKFLKETMQALQNAETILAKE